jgi:hypothetical protein
VKQVRLSSDKMFIFSIVLCVTLQWYVSDAIMGYTRVPSNQLTPFRFHDLAHVHTQGGAL